MRISGTEPSSVILIKANTLQNWNMLPQNPPPPKKKKAEAKHDSVINPQNYNFKQF